MRTAQTAYSAGHLQPKAKTQSFSSKLKGALQRLVNHRSIKILCEKKGLDSRNVNLSTHILKGKAAMWPHGWRQLLRLAINEWSKRSLLKLANKQKPEASNAWWCDVTQWQSRGLTWTWPCPRTWAAAIRSFFWLAYRRGGMVNMTVNGREGKSHRKNDTRF